MSLIRTPQLSIEVICRLLSRFYHFQSIDGSTVKEFDSWEDRNYYFESGKSGDKFVLKIIREVLPSTSVELVQGLAEVMLFLNRHGHSCSCPVKGVDGRAVLVFEEEELFPPCSSLKCEVAPSNKTTLLLGVSKQQRYCAMVLTYIEGDMADQCSVTSKLLFNIGYFFASMNKELQTFTHPSILARRYSFDLKNLSDARPYLELVRKPERRHIYAKFMTMFESQVLPQVPYLSKGIIHNDGNMQNIVVDQDGTTISGVIDFGDCVHSCHIFELGGLVLKAIGEDDITPGKAIIEGYMECFQLPKKDLNLLYYVVLGRLTTVYVYGENTYNEDTSNEYIHKILQKVWSMSQLLHKISKEEFDKALCVTNY